MSLLPATDIARYRRESEERLLNKARSLAASAGLTDDEKTIGGIFSILSFMRDERITAEIIKQQKHLKHFYVNDDELISLAQKGTLAEEYALLKRAVPADDDPCHHRDALTMGLLTGPIRLTSKNQSAFNTAAAKRENLHYLPHQHPDLPFDDQGRIYLPLTTPTHTVETEIQNALTPLGYTITDYQAGLATDKNGKQEFRIGKILRKAGKDALYNAFHSDHLRQADKLMVVISKNANDVLRQSMNRGWISCTSPGRGEFLKTLGDVEHGAMVAYLVSKHDPDIKNPLARIALRPYFKTFNRFELKIKELEYQKSTVRLAFSKVAYRLLYGQSIKKTEEKAIFIPEKTYGLAHELFHETVENFVKNTINKNASGLYRLHTELYPDSFDAVDVVANSYDRKWVRRHILV